MSAKSTPDWKQRLKTMRTTDANLEAVCSAYLSMSEEEKVLAEEFVFFRNADKDDWNFRVWNMETYSGLNRLPDDAFERVLSRAPWRWCFSMLGLSRSGFVLGHDDSTRSERSERVALKGLSSRGRATEAAGILFWGSACGVSDMLCEYIVAETMDENEKRHLPESREVAAAATGAVSVDGTVYPKLFEAVFAAESFRKTPLTKFSPFSDMISRTLNSERPFPDDIRTECTRVVLSTSERLEKERSGAGVKYLATVAVAANIEFLDMARVMRAYDNLDPNWETFVEEALEAARDTVRSDVVRRNVDFLFERLPGIAEKFSEKQSTRIRSIANSGYGRKRVLELVLEGRPEGAADAASTMKLKEKKEFFAEIDAETLGAEIVFDVWKALFPKVPKLDASGAKETDSAVLAVLSDTLKRVVGDEIRNEEKTIEDISKIASRLPECDERRIIEEAVLNAAAGAERVDHMDGVVL